MQQTSEVLTNRCSDLKELIYTRRVELEETLNKELVIFMGPPGVGKSTIISHLLGVPLKCTKISGSFDKIIKEQDELCQIRHPVIGHDVFKSCTVYPEGFAMLDQNIILCDTAGIEEQKPHVRHLTEIFIQKCKKLKAIVIVLTIQCIKQARGAIFKKLVSQLLEIFKLQEIMDRLVFVFNKCNQDLTLQDLFDILCDMERLGATNMDKSGGIDAQYMRMIQLIMHRQSIHVMNSFEIFEKYNIMCTSLDLTSNSDFKRHFFSIIQQIKDPSQKITVIRNLRRVSLCNHIQRKVILELKRMQQCLGYYTVYTCYLKLKDVLLSMGSIQKIKIVNEAYFLTPNEIRKIIKDIQEQINRLKDQIQTIEYVVTNNLRRQDGSYHFQFRVPDNFIPKFDLGGDQLTLSRNQKNLIKGVYLPKQTTKKDKKQKPFIIQLISNQNDKIVRDLRIKQQQYEKMLQLSYRFHNGLIGQISTLFKSTNDRQQHQQKLGSFVDKMDSVINDMMYHMPSAKTLEIYEECVYLSKWLDVPQSKIETENIKQFYSKNQYFVCADQRELKWRCCLHQHYIESPMRMDCGHWIDSRCFKAFQEKKFRQKKLYCGICHKLVEPQQIPVIPQEIRVLFDRFHQKILKGGGSEAR